MTQANALSFSFQTEPDSIGESMLLAGQALRLGKARRGVMGLLSLVSFLFLATGGAATFFALTIAVGGDIKAAWIPAIAGGMLGGALGVGWNDRLLRLMTQSVVDAPFNRGPQEMQFNDQGVPLINDQARWHTTWSGVHGVKVGDKGLHIFISGIALTVPRHVIGSQEELKTTAEQLETMRMGATVR